MIGPKKSSNSNICDIRDRIDFFVCILVFGVLLNILYWNKSLDSSWCKVFAVPSLFSSNWPLDELARSCKISLLLDICVGYFETTKHACLILDLD